MESADRESRRLDILSVKKEANLSAREVGEVEVVTVIFIGLYVRVLNALDLVHFIMGHHKLVQPKMGGSWGSRARARGQLPPLPSPGAAHGNYRKCYLSKMVLISYFYLTDFVVVLCMLTPLVRFVSADLKTNNSRNIVLSSLV